MTSNLKFVILFILPLIIGAYDVGNAQSSFKFVLKINSIIFNGDTLANPKERKGQIKNHSKNRIIIYENDQTKISAFLIVRQRFKKNKTKMRFDYWNGKRWIKPKLVFSCDGPKCSFHRWYFKSTSRGSIQSTYSFHLPNENIKIDYENFEIKGKLDIYHK